MGETIKAYKGFKKNPDGTLECRGFKFEEGKTYTHDGEVKLCNSGFHACEAPVDCLGYYAPATSEFHEVELIDATEEKSDDTKRVSKTIKIGAKLDIPMLCKAQFDFVKSHTTNEHTDPNSASAGAYGAASAGESGAASAGAYGAASAGAYGAASAGESGAASAGWKGAASAGAYGAASAGASGAASAGAYGAACSKGKASVGKNGLACARGNGVKVKGGIGSILVLCEEKQMNSDIDSLVAFEIDGKAYMSDTWYTLKDGKVVECSE